MSVNRIKISHSIVKISTFKVDIFKQTAAAILLSKQTWNKSINPIVFLSILDNILLW